MCSFVIMNQSNIAEETEKRSMNKVIEKIVWFGQLSNQVRRDSNVTNSLRKIANRKLENSQ